MSTELVKYENAATAIAAAAQEESSGGFGKLMKYAKGSYFVGTEEVEAGTEFIAHVGAWMRGWVKFRSGALVDTKIGKVADGFKMPKRADLGDNDESTWEAGIGGGRKDPWVQQSYLPLEDLESGEIVTFVSGSAGGRDAIAQLCGAASKHLVKMGLPRIKLGSESYRHKQYGQIQKPKFKLVGWQHNDLHLTAEECPPIDEAGYDYDFDDAVPFK